MISLAAGVLPDHTPQTTARAAKAAGFDATGIWVDRDTFTDAVTREMKTILDGEGIPALDTEVVWLMPGAADDHHKRVVDIARELGSPNVLVVTSDPDDSATAAKLRTLCEHADGAVRISLEFALFTEVKSIAQAAAIVRAVDHPAQAMLIDPLHLARSGGTPADVAALPREWFPYAQFCDAGPLTFDTADTQAIIEEAVDRRLQVGEGELPLGELLAALPANVPLSIELRSKALRDGYADPVERARSVLDAHRRFLGRFLAGR
jgi:sugar phosphate isomerase/epimerase